MTDQVFLYLTQETTPGLIEPFRKLTLEAGEFGEVFLLYHHKLNHVPKVIRDEKHFLFTNEVLYEHNYIPIGFSLVPGNNHFPLLKFYQDYPDYDYYWYIEDDVRFSGNWESLFSAFGEVSADFISSHIQRAPLVPNWPIWDTLANPYKIIPFEDRIRSFNPIYRISRKALAFIQEALQSKWCGHHEVLLPTLIYQAEMEIVDFGGRGEFVSHGNDNKFYTEENDDPYNVLEGTLRWRPPFEKVGDLENKIYHPIKNT